MQTHPQPPVSSFGYPPMAAMPYHMQYHGGYYAQQPQYPYQYPGMGYWVPPMHGMPLHHAGAGGGPPPPTPPRKSEDTEGEAGAPNSDTQ